MKITTSSAAKVAQNRYKKNFDKPVQVESTYISDDYVFLNVLVGHTCKARELAQKTLKRSSLERVGHLR